MTAPRQVLPGECYLVTRRCTQRQFLLRPCVLTNQVVRYCFAVAIERTGVDVHCLCVLSNHYHAVVSDPCGRLPEFLELLHKLIAKALNTALGRWENFWSSEPTSAVRLLTSRDVLDKMAYTVANPVVAGLVKSPSEWPGVRAARWGARDVVEMPGIFFDEEGDLPHEVELCYQRPGIRPEMNDDQLSQSLQELAARRVRDARQAMRERGQQFLGVDGVLQQSQTARPKTNEPRRKLSPRIACSSTPRRVRALRQLQAFLEEYRVARLRWSGGRRQVCFPAGTYGLRVHHGVRCQPAVPS